MDLAVRLDGAAIAEEDVMTRTRSLNAIEMRVIGALMEKEQATPDYYPMTLNAVIAACNQKNNRDPVLSLSRDDVESALDGLRQDVLVWRTEGARSERWQHSLDRRWDLDGGRKAIMTLLLLRGPQTPGELRTRSERLHAFASVAEVEKTLAAMAEGFDALVRELPRQPGQRETRWTTLVGEEGEPSVGLPSGELPASAPGDDPHAAALAAATAGLARLAGMGERLAELERNFVGLKEEFELLIQELEEEADAS